MSLTCVVSESCPVCSMDQVMGARWRRGARWRCSVMARTNGRVALQDAAARRACSRGGPALGTGQGRQGGES